MPAVDMVGALVKEPLPDTRLPLITVSFPSSHPWVGPGAFCLSILAIASGAPCC